MTEDGCRDCGLWRTRKNIVGPRYVGSSPYFAVLVGEGPGDKENRKGMAFVGPSGKKLDEILAEMGFTDGIVIDNVVRCRPTKDDNPNVDRKPRMEEIDACFPKFVGRYGRDPDVRIFVALGATAIRALTGRNVNVGNTCGATVNVDGLPAPVGICYHPSAVIRHLSVPERFENVRQAFSSSLGKFLADAREKSKAARRGDEL